VTLGRYLLEVLLSDIAERERAPIVRAVVARENARSLRLCARIGLTDERDDPDERFVQRLGRIAA
jgi:RimJ/RimL family protein N-acetyltransferase